MTSMDGRVLRGVSNDGDGQVDASTIFHYHQQDDLVWAEYEGGAIRRGYLVGTSDGTTLDFRYVHIDVDGTTHAGRSLDMIEVLSDGRVRLHERWEWDSREGAGESVVEEIAPPLH